MSKNSQYGIFVFFLPVMGESPELPPGSTASRGNRATSKNTEGQEESIVNVGSFVVSAKFYGCNNDQAVHENYQH